MGNRHQAKHCPGNNSGGNELKPVGLHLKCPILLIFRTGAFRRRVGVLRFEKNATTTKRNFWGEAAQNIKNIGH